MVCDEFRIGVTPTRGVSARLITFAASVSEAHRSKKSYARSRVSSS